MSATLNGWTAPRLDDLARDVADIKRQIGEMRTEELQELKQQLHEAKIRPRIVITAYLAPFLAALIPTLLVLLEHG